MTEPWNGFPVNPEQDGWHWVNGNPKQWTSGGRKPKNERRWQPFAFTPAETTWAMHGGPWIYGGPCLRENQSESDFAEELAKARADTFQEAIQHFDNIYNARMEKGFVTLAWMNAVARDELIALAATPDPEIDA